MSYQPTLADIDELDALDQQSAAPQSQGYQPTLADMDEIDNEAGKQAVPAHRQIPGSADPSNMLNALSGFVSGAITEPARGLWNLVGKGTSRMGGPLNAYLGATIPGATQLREMVSPTEKKPFESLSASEFYKEGVTPRRFSPEEVNKTTTGEVSSLLGSLALGLLAPGGAAAQAATLPAKMGAMGAVSALQAPLFAPDTDTLTSMGIGGAVGAALPIAGKALSFGKDLFNAFRHGKGINTPERAREIQQAAQNLGVTVPLGEVVGSPGYKKLQSAGLTNMPVGLAQHYGKISEDIGSKLSTELQGMNKLPKDQAIEETVQRALKNTTSKEEQKMSQLYKARDEIANKSGKMIERNKEYQVVSDSLEKVNKSLKADPKNKQLLSLKDDLENRLPADTKNMPFSEYNFLNKALSGTIKQEEKAGNTLAASVYRKIKDARADDLAESSKTIPELSQAQKKADQYFRENVAPLRTQNVKKFTSAFADPEQMDNILTSFIKTGKNGKPRLLNKLLSNVDEPTRDAIGYEFLTRGSKLGKDGAVQVEPQKIMNAYNSLSRKSRELLFPKQKSIFEDVNTVIGAIGKDLDQLTVLKTGEKAAMFRALGALGTLSVAGGAGGAYKAEEGNKVEGALLGAVAPYLGALYLKKRLTNPKVVEEAVRRLEKSGKK